MKEKNKLQDMYSKFRRVMVQTGKTSGRRIYTDALVLWLGVYQALQLASCRGVVQELLSERAYELMGECKRKRNRKLSSNVSALIQARKGISRETLRESLNGLYQDAQKDKRWKGYRVFGVDGSTVALNRSNKELRTAYPGGRDHKRVSRWPIVHLVMLIDLLGGMVASASVGAKYGKKAVGEQELALEMKGVSKEKAILIGDRNFGTLNIAKEFSDSGFKVIVRLKEVIADYISDGASLKNNLDIKVQWYPTAGVTKKYGYDKNKELKGRLISQSFKYKGKTHKVFLFTNLEEGSSLEIIKLYKKRWHFEEDLKSMKLKLRLNDIQAETKEAVEVELFCKLMAFNITRAMILLAVAGTDIDPRRISFATAFTIVRTCLSGLALLKSAKARDEVLEEMLERIVTLALNPERPNRHYPRQVYGRRSGRYKIISSAL